uniref:Uncharacterized protein n=1 Tax=Cacopsylla melanoneura TaxID=428564 RepID=A0A8D8SRC2_9HEMI
MDFLVLLSEVLPEVEVLTQNFPEVEVHHSDAEVLREAKVLLQRFREEEVPLRSFLEEEVPSQSFLEEEVLQEALQEEMQLDVEAPTPNFQRVDLHQDTEAHIDAQVLPGCQARLTPKTCLPVQGLPEARTRPHTRPVRVSSFPVSSRQDPRSRNAGSDDLLHRKKSTFGPTSSRCKPPQYIRTN